MPPRIRQSPLDRQRLNISTSAGIQSYERGLVVPKTSPRADTQSFIGQTIEQIGAQGSRLASQLQAGEAREQARLLKEKDETDRAAASESFLQFSDQEREVLTNLTGRRLGAADGATKEAQDNYEKLIRTFSDGLANDAQRVYFRSLADTRRSAGLNRIAAHEAREKADWKKSGQIGLINEGIQYGADNFKDLSMIALAEDYIKTGVYGLMEGASSVAKEAMLKEKLSTMHETIYNRWLAVDPETAQNYYKQYQDKFDPLKKAGIEKEISEKVLLRQAQNKTDDIIAEHPNDLQAQLDEVRKIQDPLQQSEVNKRIKIRHQEDQELIRIEEEKFKNNMTDQILSAKTVGEAYQLADSAPGKHRKEMLNVVKSRIQRDNVITKIPKLIEARARIDAGDITTPQQLWREYRLDLSRQDWTTLDAYLRDGGKAQLQDSHVRSIYKSISGKAADKTPETYQAIWEVVSRNTKALGRKPDDDILRKWIKNLMMTGEYQRRFLWDPDASYIQAKQAGRIDQWLPKVTDEETAQITVELKKIPGQKVNEQTIREYKKYHLMGIPLPEQNR